MLRPGGVRYDFSVEASDTIGKIKALIDSALHIPADRQRIRLRNSALLLHDFETLVDAGGLRNLDDFKCGDMVYLRLAGYGAIQTTDEQGEAVIQLAGYEQGEAALQELFTAKPTARVPGCEMCAFLRHELELGCPLLEQPPSPMVLCCDLCRGY
jgi:hypothetical protein